MGGGVGGVAGRNHNYCVFLEGDWMEFSEQQAERGYGGSFPARTIQ
jgi:hypothetical protein